MSFTKFSNLKKILIFLGIFLVLNTIISLIVYFGYYINHKNLFQIEQLDIDKQDTEIKTKALIYRKRQYEKSLKVYEKILNLIDIDSIYSVNIDDFKIYLVIDKNEVIIHPLAMLKKINEREILVSKRPPPFFMEKEHLKRQKLQIRKNIHFLLKDTEIVIDTNSLSMSKEIFDNVVEFQSIYGNTIKKGFQEIINNLRTEKKYIEKDISIIDKNEASIISYIFNVYFKQGLLSTSVPINILIIIQIFVSAFILGYITHLLYKMLDGNNQ